MRYTVFFAVTFFVYSVTVLADETNHTMNFDAQQVGTESDAKEYSIENEEKEPGKITERVISGAEKSDFEVEGCSKDSDVEGGESCTLEVKFKPTSTGENNQREATIKITLMVGDESTLYTIKLVAERKGKTPKPKLELSSDGLSADGKLDFGKAETATTKTLAISNNGEDESILTGITFSVDGTAFGVSEDNCKDESLLASGKSCMVKITFTPKAGETSNATLKITSNASDRPTEVVTLTGKGVEAVQKTTTIDINEAALKVGTVKVGESQTDHKIEITNTSTAPLKITAVNPTSGEFAVALGTCENAEVAANESCELDVTFKPTEVGERNAILTITANVEKGSQTVTLTGTGKPKQTENQLPTASFTVTPESGTAPLTVELDATASTDSDGTIEKYEWTSSCGGTIKDGENTSDTLDSAGSCKITLTVTDDKGETDTVDKTVLVQQQLPPSPYPELTQVFSIPEDQSGTAKLFGGISVNGASFELAATDVKQLKVDASGAVTQKGDLITVEGVIIPNSEHVDKPADIIVVALYSSTDISCDPSKGDYYMLTKPGRGDLNNNYCAWIYEEGEKPDYCHHEVPNQSDAYYTRSSGQSAYLSKWNGQLDSLLPLARLDQLSSEEKMMLYQDRPRYTGHVCINFGYRLQDEPKTLIFNGDPIKFSVVP